MLIIDSTGITDQATKTNRAGLSEFHDTLADIVGGIHGHHLTRNHDIDFFCLTIPNRHGETAAYNIAQNIVKGVVKRFTFFIGTEGLQHIN